MALGDKLNTIDTIENLATNRDFLGKLITELSKGANNAGIYTKKGVDDELKKKADKNYVDTELGKKAGAADLANKANTADVYTKKDADDALKLKANVAGDNLLPAFVTALAAGADDNGVYTKTAAENTFLKTADLVTKVAEKAVAKAIFNAQDGTKSILVDKLGGFLDNTKDSEYGAKSDQTAKVFLGGKGLKGEKGDPGPKGADGKDGAQGPQGEKGANGKDGKSPSTAEIAAVQALQQHVAKISIKSPEFKEAVQEEMSQPSFEIPTSDDAALNWTW